jgi:hypothetical protein
MNTVEGRIKGVETMRKLHGDDIYAKIGALGGKNSPNRPMRDPEYARKLANIRWLKYRLANGEISVEEYDEELKKLNVRNTKV